MSLNRFLCSLVADGRAVVGQMAEPVEADAREPIREMYRSARLQCPGTAPALAEGPAHWAALQLYRSCQFLVYREVGAEEVHRTLSHAFAQTDSPEAIFSVDLCFRHLPTLLLQARQVAKNDPLVEHLLTLARQWPLSSVGAAEVGAVDVANLTKHPALWALYVDRVLQRDDANRLADLRVWEAAATALGGRTDVSPAFARLERERRRA